MQEVEGSNCSPSSPLDQRTLAQFPLSEAFTRAANDSGYATPEAAAWYSLFNPMWLTVMNSKDSLKTVKWIPGTRLKDGLCGPVQHYEVMVVGKMPGAEEVERNRVFCGKSGELLLRAAQTRKCLDVFQEAYGTNVSRFVPPDDASKLRPACVKDSLPLLAQELALIKPLYVLLLGTDAVKVFFGGKFTLSKARSHCFVLPDAYCFGESPIDADHVDKQTYDNGIKIFATIHPAAVLREIGFLPGFEKDIERFAALTRREVRGNVTVMNTSNYVYVRQYDQLKVVVDHVLSSGLLELAVDCEWGGTFPTGSLRTIQFCWAPGEACVVILRFEHMHDAQSASERTRMMMELKRLFHAPGMRIVGHNIRADAKWLALEDIPIMSRVSFDTMLADHILNENSEHGLEDCVMRMTDLGRYDLPLKNWVSKHAPSEKDGYADIPDDILHPYAACDADGTFRLIKPLRDRLNQPDLAGVKSCFETIVLPCMQPIHEIEMNGLAVDRQQMEELVWAFDAKKKELVSHLRNLVGSPYFNFRSCPQVAQLLFGKIQDGGLELRPLKTTEKPTRMWEDLWRLTDHEKSLLSPSTDMETLKHLAAEYPNVPIVLALADLRVVDQVAKSFMRTPKIDPYTGDEIYESGLVGQIDPDGRVRSSFSQMSETGRWKSHDPNLQNLPNKQDAEIVRIMGEGVPKIRSCFIALEEVDEKGGWVLIEADYKSAEVFTLGYLSNCEKLLSDAKTDLHARAAVVYFKTPKWDGYDEGKKPPADWLSKYKHLRSGAKTVNFGIPYQRGAKAVAREVTKSTNGKVECDMMQAQEYINQFYETYTDVANFVDMAKASVLYPGFLEQPFGRRRRFSAMGDPASIAAQQREAVNFPIQSTVADMLNIAMYNLWVWRQAYPNEADYKIVLGVHDSIFLEVRGPSVPVVIQTVLPSCMQYGVIVPSWMPRGCRVSEQGVPMHGQVFYERPTKPFSLEVDVNVMTRWGVKASKEELIRRGVPSDWVNKHGKE
jgi:uracil-DNA glycosylase family 4